MQNTKNVYMILTNSFNPDVRVYKEAKYLVKQGFNVTILCWDRKCEFIDKCTENVDGIIIKRFSIPANPGTGMKQLLSYFKFIRVVKKYLKNKEYSYLHCHDFDGILIGMITAKKKQKKVVFDMHEIYKNYAYAKFFFFDYLYNQILKKSDYIIYVNEKQVSDMLPEIKKKTIYLPNYPELDIYKPIEKKETNIIRVNYIGSLRDYDSLKSLAKLGEDNDNIKVGLYGTGICLDTLKKEYQNSRIEIYGKYNGILESGEIYRNTDILYCSYNPNVENWKNAYPVKLFEAIVTLTPVIVSTNTITEKFVKEYGIGEAVEYANKESIYNAITKISKNYSVYVKNLKKISGEYKWETAVKHLDKIYH